MSACSHRSGTNEQRLYQQAMRVNSCLKQVCAAFLDGLQRQARIRRLSGKAALFSGDTAGAAADFQAAVELKPGALGAWEGVAQLKAASGEMAEAAETYQKLVRAPTDCGQWALRRLRTCAPCSPSVDLVLLGRVHIGLAQCPSP